MGANLQQNAGFTSTYGVMAPLGDYGGVVLPPKYFLLLPAKYERMRTENEYSIPLG